MVRAAKASVKKAPNRQIKKPAATRKTDQKKK